MKSCPFKASVLVFVVLIGAIFSHNLNRKHEITSKKDSGVYALDHASKEVKFAHKVSKFFL